MPVHRTKSGFRFGKTGKTYGKKADAMKQARAVYASGWRDEARSKTRSTRKKFSPRKFR